MHQSKNRKSLASARDKFLSSSLESTRKSYYPLLQKQLENAREKEKQLQLLIDNMPAQIAYVDSFLNYIQINRSCEEAHGLRRNQIIGRKVKEILGSDRYEQCKDYIKKALSGQNLHYEMAYAMDGASKRWYDVTYIPDFSDTGEVQGYYSLIIDLTEKKEAQKEQFRLKDRLRHAEKMEAIGTLSGGIAHDFNNILSGIFGYSQLAEMNIHDAARAKGYIQKIVEAAKRASSLIEQILTFSRQKKINRHPIKILTLVKEVIRLIRSTIPANIEIRENLNCSEMILADPTQIHQVIMNLCTNAHHAMGNKNGRLTITLDTVEDKDLRSIPRSGRSSSERFARLSITDTGPGISPEIKERIFDPYFTTKPLGKGTGLGLAVVSGIVKKHRGFLRLDSSPGAGTTFHVFLPLVSSEDTVSEAVKMPDKLPGGSEKIMLVDDEPAILYSMKSILSMQGYQVFVFPDGLSAFKAFQLQPETYDLIITDMAMPHMTGDRLSRKILETRSDIPIVICTGFHESFGPDDAHNIGIRKYLKKPVLGPDLCKIIRELFDSAPAGDMATPDNRA